MNSFIEYKRVLRLIDKTIKEVCQEFDIVEEIINYGYCPIFAHKLNSRLNGKGQYVSCDNHVVIYYDGMFYDSTGGYKTFREVPDCDYFEDEEIFIQNEQEFVKFWYINGQMGATIYLEKYITNIGREKDFC